MFWIDDPVGWFINSVCGVLCSAVYLYILYWFNWWSLTQIREPINQQIEPTSQDREPTTPQIELKNQTTGSSTESFWIYK